MQAGPRAAEAAAAADRSACRVEPGEARRTRRRRTYRAGVRPSGEARRDMGEGLEREQLATRVANERRAGRTVAFANGCFDLLRVGHVRYLEAAAEEADVLIVALNDDAGVRQLKGEKRPILSAEHRAALVAALRCVDVVVIFPEPTV